MSTTAPLVDWYRACARNAFDDKAMCAFISHRVCTYREANALYRCCAHADPPKTARPERKRARPDPEAEPMEEEPQRTLLNVTVLPPYRALPGFHPTPRWREQPSF